MHSQQQQRVVCTMIAAVAWLLFAGILASASKHGGYEPGTPATEQTTGTQPTGSVSPKDIVVILNEHNVYREREDVPPLKWNTTLARAAQDYADSRKGDCAQVHSTTPYGENLMQITGTGTWKETVDIWGDEKTYYHYKSNSCDGGQMCGHYEAVVWKDTTDVGCGRVTCNSGDSMLVCEYWPPGFVDGQRPF